MYQVVERRMIVPNLHELTVLAPAVAESVKPGQFVIVRPDISGERIPLSVAGWDRDAGTVTSIFMQVGESTAKLARLKPGDSLPTYAGPLGKPTVVDAFGTVLCVGGCYGIGSLYPVARALKDAGNKVYALLEARGAFLVYWEDKFAALADGLFVVTRDGTKGWKGHVNQLPEIIGQAGIKPELVVVNGCTFLMMRVSQLTKPLGWRTVVNMNPLMIDGTGMCGVCRLSVGGKMKFACVDGPEFDGHEIDWEEFLARRKSYNPEEVEPLRRSSCRPHVQDGE
ncbi:MAG: sulfide/dihydroorotate dehydrogenase-like FAD/NAD-binding protein [Candidatus Aminicenantes bacterium]|nr:sulfide/dihydroorotate dehydrogenase-like FAD/NAD-binding protein [Candidatus Aminicenantes bacterium]